MPKVMSLPMAAQILCLCCTHTGMYIHAHTHVYTHPSGKRGVLSWARGMKGAAPGHASLMPPTFPPFSIKKATLWSPQFLTTRPFSLSLSPGGPWLEAGPCWSRCPGARPRPSEALREGLPGRWG